MAACNCDNQKFIKYRLSENQGKKIIPQGSGQFYLHMPCNPDESLPHIFCDNGMRQDISMEKAFKL